MAANDLSQAEVWDDSALLDSWNEALEEYQKYHSLAVKGQKVQLTAPTPKAKVAKSEDAATTNATREEETASSMEQVQENASVPPFNAASAFPQLALPTIANEELRNLMMSWYYAGYYTGLYEGKQQGYASAMQHKTGAEYALELHEACPL